MSKRNEVAWVVSIALGVAGATPAAAQSLSAPALQAAPSASLAPAQEPKSPRWLPWAFVGLGANASAAAVAAWILRERYARQWNSDRCLAPQQTRGEVCADRLASGRTAESVAYASGVGAALSFGAALTLWLLDAPRADGQSTTALACAPSLGGASCRASF